MSIIKKDILDQILHLYGLNAQAEISLLGEGHIHNTYLLQADRLYVLQKMNRRVFPNILDIYENLMQVEHYIEKSQKQYPLEWILTKELQPYAILPDESSYRLMNYIEHDQVYQFCPNELVAFQSGKAIGKFHQNTIKIPVDSLKEIIPNFHDLSYRIHQLEDASIADKAGRITQLEQELFFFMERRDRWIKVNKKLRGNEIPPHLTHNDTKLNNILFDKDIQAICLIDIDTIMAGYYLYDVGDLIRSATCLVSEDDPMEDEISFHIEFFEQIIAGYSSVMKHLLSEEEVRTLHLSGMYMTLIMAARFLADFLNGDIYYKVSHENQNLNRARHHIRLFLAMESQEEKLKDIVDKYCI